MAVSSLCDVRNLTKSISANEEAREAFTAHATSTGCVLGASPIMGGSPRFGMLGTSPLLLGGSPFLGLGLGGASGPARSFGSQQSGMSLGAGGQRARQVPTPAVVQSGFVVKSSTAGSDRLSRLSSSGCATNPRVVMRMPTDGGDGKGGPMLHPASSTFNNNNNNYGRQGSSTNLEPSSTGAVEQQQQRGGGGVLASVMASWKSAPQLPRDMDQVQLQMMSSQQQQQSGKLSKLSSKLSKLPVDAMSEDVLLRMVENANMTRSGARQLVAHVLSPLDRTVLAHAREIEPPAKRGTWISDVATYMSQPNRPGRDIVLSPLSPSVASLVVACLGATPRLTGETSVVSFVNSPAARALRSDSGLDGDQAAEVVVYLTSGITLTPLQLQVGAPYLRSRCLLCGGQGCMPSLNRLQSQTPPPTT